jgi:drug/metabolite transporter (DMT)-like permease
MSPASRRTASLPDLVGLGSPVILLGLASALTWGAGDFGGGMLSRRAPLFGVVGGTQLVGIVAALALAVVRGEPLPQGADILWSTVIGICGVVGISSLYRGLAVGRMGVVAPVTGVVGAVIPVAVGFALEGVPGTAAVAGIAVALVAVVLVTRAPGHADGRPSGLRWALIAGIAIGGFNIGVGQLSEAGAFGPLVIIRLLQVMILAVLIVAWRQPWRPGRDAVPWIVLIGVLDMFGNAAFILATQSGQLAIAAVLSSLYPVTTVILAIVVLRERMTRSHVAGIALTAVGIALIAYGTAG